MPVPGPSPGSPTVPVPDELPGLWRRTLLAAPGRHPDTTTWVARLQGPGLYVDLRQPAGFVHPAGARGLGDLDRGQLCALAAQEGFAGRLRCDEGLFRWRRVIDLHPSTGLPDLGRVTAGDGLLVEEGAHEAYLEHWRRDDPAGSPAGAAAAGRSATALLRDPESDRKGLLVRAGAWFGYARGRDPLVRLPPGTRLAELVEGADNARTARTLLDCEISLGRVGPDCWTVRRSVLPGRAGRRFCSRTTVDGLLVTSGTGPYGGPVAHRWQVVDAEGPFPLLLSDTAFPEVSP